MTNNKKNKFSYLIVILIYCFIISYPHNKVNASDTETLRLSNLQVEQINSDQAYLSWEVNKEYLSNYTIKKRVDKMEYETDTIYKYFYDTNLESGRTYYYTVGAYSFEDEVFISTDEVPITIKDFDKKPNLKLENLYFKPMLLQTNQEVEINFTIVNAGDAPVVIKPAISAYKKKDGEEYEKPKYSNGYYTVPSANPDYFFKLNPGESIPAVAYGFEQDWKYDMAGDYMISVKIDFYNYIAESNENDNEISGTLKVVSQHDFVPPSNPTNISVERVKEAGKLQLKIKWTTPPDEDLYYVQIYKSSKIGELGDRFSPTIDNPYKSDANDDRNLNDYVDHINYYYTFRSVDNFRNESTSTNQYGVDGLVPVDFDNDELKNFDEALYGSDPEDADTDGDGLADGAEVENGYSPTVKATTVDKKLVNRLKGWILLQVQGYGEAWYVYPKNGKRYYLKDGDAAYEIMRYLSLGITNADLAKIPQSNSDNVGNQTLVNQLKGKILLQTEQHGEAWYVNPADGKRYYLRDGNAAYQIMRNLSLGIKNDDISKIPAGVLKME